MSDASGEIMLALKALLRANDGVVAAFGANKVRLYDLAPEASAESLFPYITLADVHQVDQEFEGLDAGEATVNLHVWSRTDPPSTAEAKTIAAAAKVAISNLGADGLALTGYRLIDALPIDTQVMLDPDGQTVHAVVRVTYSYDPV